MSCVWSGGPKAAQIRYRKTEKGRALVARFAASEKGRIAKEKNKQQLRERTRENYALVQTLKNVPCLDCNHNFPACCMDFDHVRGEKVTDVSQLYLRKEAMLKEIAKCDIVCANCHRIRTHARSLQIEIAA